MGHNVTILEQRFSITYEAQAAEIVTMEHSQAFLSRHELLAKQPYTADGSAVQILNKVLKVIHNFNQWDVNVKLECIVLPSQSQL